MSSHHHDDDAVSGENELERLLRLAASEPAHRPAFFRELLDSTVYILGDSEQVPHDGEITLNAETPVNIQHWEKQDGSSVVPFSPLWRCCKTQWRMNNPLSPCPLACCLKSPKVPNCS